MRLLLCSAGADFSTKDVENGYRAALKAQGHQIIEYNLSRRIDVSRQFLTMVWRKGMRKLGEPQPNDADAYYHASIGVLERALRFDVDWVIAVSAMYLHPDILIMLRRAGKRIAVLFTESPYEDEQQAKVAPLCDVVFTCERTSARRYGWVYLPHAYDPAKHRPLEPDPAIPAHDVVFVGTGFQERIELLSAVNWDGIDLGLYGTWMLMGSRSKLRKYLRGSPVNNEYAVGLYRRAKIGLNLYRTSKGFGYRAPRIMDAESLNPRALELAACGVFQISDYRQEVEEVFDDSVATFSTAQGLEDWMRHYLGEPALCSEMARAAAGSVAGHTFAARAQQVIGELERASRPALVAVG